MCVFRSRYEIFLAPVYGAIAPLAPRGSAAERRILMVIRITLVMVIIVYCSVMVTLTWVKASWLLVACHLYLLFFVRYCCILIWQIVCSSSVH